MSLPNDSLSNSAESDPLSPSSNGIPLKKIAQAWNRALEANQGAMPKLMKIQSGTQRYRHIRARWHENPSLDTWQALIEKAAKSSFLNGDNAKGWMASFDWLVKSKDNFLKCLEGNYDDKGASNAEPF